MSAVWLKIDTLLDAACSTISLLYTRPQRGTRWRSTCTYFISEAYHAAKVNWLSFRQETLLFISPGYIHRQINVIGLIFTGVTNLQRVRY